MRISGLHFLGSLLNPKDNEANLSICRKVDTEDCGSQQLTLGPMKRVEREATSDLMDLFIDMYKLLITR